jgi:hypothetical protein
LLDDLEAAGSFAGAEAAVGECMRQRSAH